ncbi:B3/4 domain protein [Eubacterium nodatum ATCC 33099]|nr:B3/4 domain protein [Eubacterium nodatum ATCC 33099]
MKKFITEESFWSLFPDAEIGVVVLNDVDNSDSVYEDNEIIRDDLAKANQEAGKWITATPLSKNEVIKVWRDAFQKFKKKKGNRASIEALLARIDKGNYVGGINPLVDVYNAISLTYGLPIGGEDIDNFAGNLRLTVSEEGGDEFMALGDEENNPTLPGELCYLDDIGAVCRCWNWRDGKRTMLTGNTKNAFMIIESVDPGRHGDLVEALDLMEENAVKYLGAKALVKTILTKENREVMIEE